MRPSMRAHSSDIIARRADELTQGYPRVPSESFRFCLGLNHAPSPPSSDEPTWHTCSYLP
jgi:hypothetical protein